MQDEQATDNISNKKEKRKMNFGDVRWCVNANPMHV